MTDQTTKTTNQGPPVRAHRTRLGPRMKRLARGARKRCLDNQHFLMAVVGPTGTGKSGLALQFALEAQLAPLDIKVQVCFSLEDYEAAIRTLPAGTVIILDEVLKAGGNRRRAMSGRNVTLMEHVNTARKLNHITILVLPYMDDLDSGIMKHLHYLLKLDHVGHGVAFEVIRLGLKKTKIWLQARFAFSFPNCEEEHAAVWREYFGLAMAFLKGQRRGSSGAAGNERIQRFADVLRKIIRRRRGRVVE